MRLLLKFILKLLSKAVIKKYKPLVIGITGSVGKTSTKEAVFQVLRKRFSVRANDANFNNEIGFPMAILGLKTPGKLIWIKNILSSIKLLLVKDRFYPKVLVLEMAADRPGDIKYLVNIARPKIGIITGVGELPVHVEFYSGPDQVAKEKSELVKSLPGDGLAILNHDDEVVYDMKDVTKTKVITFGFEDNAEISASDLRYFFENSDSKEVRAGLSFKVSNKKSTVPFRLNNALGRPQVYSVLAATAVGLYFGMNLVEISQTLENFDFPPHRMKLLKGINNSFIIDDTYNASPLSVHAALDTLKDFGEKIISKIECGRKIAVLGDMLELGTFTEKAHRQVGNLAGERVQYLFTVGSRAKFIADSAFNQLPKENIKTFDNADEAKEEIKKFIKEGDIVLVKGSRAMRMEKIVEELISQ